MYSELLLVTQIYSVLSYQQIFVLSTFILHTRIFTILYSNLGRVLHGGNLILLTEIWSVSLEVLSIVSLLISYTNISSTFVSCTSILLNNTMIILKLIHDWFCALSRKCTCHLSMAQPRVLNFVWFCRVISQNCREFFISTDDSFDF